jgi:hypothetical protein
MGGGLIVRLRVEDLTWQDLDGEVVVLDLRGSAYYQLNGSGALLWRRLAGGGDRSDLESALRDTYAVDRRQARDDVDAFLSSLVGAGLVDP